MAKKKHQDIIKVKSPKVGSDYYFMFAGSITLGTLACVNEKLTKHYGHKWYTLVRTETRGETRYPVSIYNIGNTYEDLKRY